MKIEQIITAERTDLSTPLNSILAYYAANRIPDTGAGIFFTLHTLEMIIEEDCFEEPLSDEVVNELQQIMLKMEIASANLLCLK